MTLGKGSKINIKFSLTWDLAQTFHQSTYKILRRLLLLLLLLCCCDKSFYIDWDLYPMIQGYSDKKKNEALRAPCPPPPSFVSVVWEMTELTFYFAGTLCCIPNTYCGGLTWALQNLSEKKKSIWSLRMLWITWRMNLNSFHTTG